MSIETERKYRLSEKRLEEIISKLNDLKAEFDKEVFEVNYQHRGGEMDERGATLRLRKIGDFTVLTYKEKLKTEGGTKQKIEFETSVSDVEATERIIERLGYKLTAVYEKRRKYWKLGAVEVVLDELPFGCTEINSLFLHHRGEAHLQPVGSYRPGIHAVHLHAVTNPRLRKSLRYGK